MDIRKILLHSLCVVCLVQCKNDSKKTISPAPQSEEVPLIGNIGIASPGDATPPEINDFIDNIPENNAPLEDLYLDNGQSLKDFLEQYKKTAGGRISIKLEPAFPEIQKQLFISALGEVAQRLCNRENFKIDAEGDGKISPKQYGLAYSWGQTDYGKRDYPPSELDAKCFPKERCNYRVRGLDCSGFVINLLREAINPYTNALLFPDMGDIIKSERPNSHIFGRVSYWNNKIFPQNTNFNSLQMIDMGQIPAADMISGDILYFTSGHVGFIIGKGKGSKTLAFYQSNGTQNDVDCGRKPAGQCAQNYSSEKRGVHSVAPDTKATFQEKINSFIGGGSYKILRVAAQDEYMACSINDHLFNGTPLGGGKLYKLGSSQRRPNTLSLLFSDGDQFINLILAGFNKKPGKYKINGLSFYEGDGEAYYTSDKKTWGTAFNVEVGSVTVTNSSESVVEGVFEFSLGPYAASSLADPMPGTGTKVFKSGSFKSKFVEL